jgi:hypothetical protein
MIPAPSATLHPNFFSTLHPKIHLGNQSGGDRPSATEKLSFSKKKVPDKQVAPPQAQRLVHPANLITREIKKKPSFLCLNSGLSSRCLSRTTTLENSFGTFSHLTPSV